MRAAFVVCASLLLPLPPSAAFTPHERLLHALHAVAAADPLAPINDTCAPPLLPEQPVCTGGQAFTGKRHPSPRRLYSMLLLGFEVDTLEILLREQVGLVDMFCLVESTRAHFNQSAKPLMWERLKWSDRFAFAAPKVLHVVSDDGAMGRTDDVWFTEMTQGSHGAKECATAIQERFGYRPDDLLISASPDEILGAPTLQRLRWCSLLFPVLGSAVWMPAGGDLTRAVRVDHHPSLMPHAHGLPTIFKLHTLRWFGRCSSTKLCFDGTRLFKTPTPRLYIVGGVHLTWAPFLPHVYLKELTGTSYNGGSRGQSFWLQQIHRAAALDRLDQLQLAIPDRVFLHRLAPLARLPFAELEIVYTPWFLQCNPNRFPYWFRKPDPRNALLLTTLQQVGALPPVSLGSAPVPYTVPFPPESVPLRYLFARHPSRMIPINATQLPITHSFGRYIRPSSLADFEPTPGVAFVVRFCVSCVVTLCVAACYLMVKITRPLR